MSDVAVVTLSAPEIKSGTGAKGPWTLSIFRASDGREYTTLDGALASKASALVGQPVRLSYTLRQNGKYTNYNLADVQPVEGVEGHVVQDKTPTGPLSGINHEDERQLRIMRQSALERALRAFEIAVSQGAPLDPVANTSELYELADEFIDYFTNGNQVTAE